MSDSDRLPAPPAPIPWERVNFKTLLLQNPNYFGSLPDSDLAVVKQIKSDTSFEQLVCVGLNPITDRLEGVVDIKRESGYGGSICQPGTKEYVRFFVDLYDNGTWHDVGVTNVGVHDIPGKKPLSYAVYLDFSPYKKLCTRENIVKVRAILQWNAPPPSNPNFQPSFGNRVDVEVQIQPKYAIKFSDVLHELELAEVAIPDPIGPIVEALDPATELTVSMPQELTFAERKKLYACEDVPLHRFAYPDVAKFLDQPDPNGQAKPGKGALASLGLSANEVESLMSVIIKTDGDTGYEELRCIGFNPEARQLEGVLTIKNAFGYGGPLCANGTLEYVAFYVDFGEGNGLEWVGTTSVNVHDLKTIPNGDVQYAVYLKRDFAKHQIPCQKGAKVVHLRAILSWATPPPPGNPNWIPVWGNREDRLIQLAPSAGHGPRLEFVAGVDVDGIGGNGLTIAGDRPFGGNLQLVGHIGDPTDSVGGGAPPLKYRFEVTGPPPFNAPKFLMDPMSVQIQDWANGNPQMCGFFKWTCPRTLTPTDASYAYGPGWYDYLEDHTPPDERELVGDLLGTWVTTVAMEGTWTIAITALDPATGIQYPGNTVTVTIDNTRPSGPAGAGATPDQDDAMPPLKITAATFKGEDVFQKEGCGKYVVGTVLTGTYEVHDPGVTAKLQQHFGSLTLDVTPDSAANGAATTPSFVAYPVDAPTTGIAGTWTLDTAGMDACGYNIRLVAYDRTIVSGNGPWQYVYDIGFCLE